MAAANCCISEADESDFFLNGIDQIFTPSIADLVPHEMNGLTFGQVAMGYVMLVYKDGTGRKATRRLEQLREANTDSGISSMSSVSTDSIDTNSSAASFAGSAGSADSADSAYSAGSSSPSLSSATVTLRRVTRQSIK